MNPLEAHIRRLIARHGPITVAEYMGLCLGHPDHGYYNTRDPFGRGGDFTTSPEISQMFGEVLGAWCIDRWRRMGEPKFDLIEFGPGRGTLMADMLRTAGKVTPAFVQAATVQLVEMSPVLRDKQAAALAGYEVLWHEAIEDIPDGPALYVMNEFLDALPVRQFVMTEAGLAERCVWVDAGTDRLAFVVERQARVPLTPSSPSGGEGRDERMSTLCASESAPHPNPFPHWRRGNDAPLGTIIETNPAALAITRELCARLHDHGGAALIVDYGYDQPGQGETLQAVKGHARADPLENSGEADLTAHVDFAALAEAARQAGGQVEGPYPQGEFLPALGIQHRAETLAAAGSQAALPALRRLTAPDQMGVLFKAMVLSLEP